MGTFESNAIDRFTNYYTKCKLLQMKTEILLAKKDTCYGPEIDAEIDAHLANINKALEDYE